MRVKTVADRTGGPRSADAGWRQLARVTGIAGLVTMVLVFVPAIAGSGQEPSFDGTSEEIVTFFQSISSPLAAFFSFLSSLGMIAFLWFVIGLSVLLRAVERDPPWRSTVAAASGVVLDSQVARYALDVGNATFANGWVALGGFAVCCGWVIVPSGFVPRWLGWWAVVSGVGLALSRVVWTSWIWFLPYAMFWLWVVTLSILLVRRRAGATHRAASGSEP